MRKSDLIANRLYATRGSAPDQPLVKVKYLGTAHKDRAKVRFETGALAGLTEWVRTRELLCRWSERTAFTRDEDAAGRLRAVDADAFDKVVEQAVSAVMTASGEYGGLIGTWTTDPGSALRFWDRARLDGSPLGHHPANFADRHGIWHLSFLTAVYASQNFAASEPELVDLYLRRWEEELKAEGFLPGRSHRHDLLREWAPSHALARSWSQRLRGEAAEREVKRLQELVRAAATDLRKYGHEAAARRVERGLEGR